MRKLVSLCVLVLVVLLPGCHPDKAEIASLRVGAASATVNPEPGTFLAGYDTNRKCTGVHDNLYAKAVVFDDGKMPVALVIVDSIGLEYDTVQELRKAASAATKAVTIPPERIVVASTHTHCSPDVIGIYGPDQTTTGRDATYMSKLVRTAAEQVARAAERIKPATLMWTQVSGMTWAVNDSEPDVLVKEATILQCLDATRASIATLTNFACHPTVLDGDTTEASADWVGAFYTDMSAALPGEHLFLQGGVGGWVQPETPERTFKLAEQYGKDIAAKVLGALQSAKPVNGTGIRFASKVFGMPNENPLFTMMGTAGLIPRSFGETIETEVAWFAVGDAQFATQPGETAPAFTLATYELMDTAPKFVLGLGLDQLGYILKPEYFERTAEIPHAEYLVQMSPGKQAGPAMMAALESIIP